MAYLQTLVVKIVTGSSRFVFNWDDFQNIAAGIVRFLRLVETCLELDRLLGHATDATSSTECS